jgi:DNA-binding NarL/FixJ family response regulator
VSILTRRKSPVAIPQVFRTHSRRRGFFARDTRQEATKASNPVESEAAIGDQRYGNCVTSEREQLVIELVAQGLKNCEVADSLGTTEHVVKNYLRIIYDKLGLWNRVELALWHEARKHENSAGA